MSEIKYMAGKEGIQELWRRIKAEIGKFTAFQKAAPAADGTPDIALADRKTNIIYLVPISGSADPDHYMEWIWSVPESADPEWVCIGDTSTDTPKYVDVSGTVSGTTQTVDLTHNRLARISIDSGATELVINVPAEEADRVGWFRFDFTLPEDTVMERVRVLDSTGTETLLFVPMRYPGPVTYKGEVVDSLAKIIGYPDHSHIDPLNPLGLPDYTIRLKFDTTDEPTFSHGEATLVESSRGGWSIWDLTYASSDWTQLLYGQSHLVEVLGANSTNVTNMTGMFNGCANLERLAIFDTSRVDNMLGIFGGCAKLETPPDFDYSEVTNMCYAFTNCSALKAFIADTPSLRIAKGMFDYCTSLETIEFDSSKITDFSFMFQGCRSLVHGPDIDTSSAKTMKQMFDGCSALEDIPQYDTRKVADFYETFNYCDSLTTVPSLNTSIAQTMEMMFCNCSSLTEAPEMTTSTVENMKYMFQSCSALNTVPSYSTDSLEECEAMFRGSGITEVPNIDFSKVKVLDSLFAGCMNLTTVPMMNLNKAVSVNYMFSYCNKVEHGAFNLYASLLGISKLTEHVDTFKDCGKDTETGLAELEQIMTSWGGLCEIPANTFRCKYAPGTSPINGSNRTCTKVSDDDNIWDISGLNETYIPSIFAEDTNLVEIIVGNIPATNTLSNAFYHASNLTKVGKLITSVRLTSCHYTFEGCTSLQSVETFNTDNVQTMNSMFEYCSSLITAPFLDTHNVTEIQWMFNGCSSLSEVPHYDTSSAKYMYDMFQNCSAITTIPLFDTHNAVDLRYMFYGCSSLTEVPLIDTSSVTQMEYAFENCYNVETGALALYLQASSQTNPPSSHTETFTNCGRDTTTGLADLEEIPEDWGGISVPNITLRFTEGIIPEFSKGRAVQISTTPNIWKLKTPGETSWQSLLSNQVELLEVIDVKTNDVIIRMDYMFYGCSKLTTVCDMNTENVQNVDSMFMDCTSLTTVAPFSTNRITSFEQLFCGCTALTELPNLRYVNVSKTGKMCQRCTNLRSVDLSCTNLRDGYDMFNQCTGLISANIEVSMNLQTTRNMFGNCSSLTSVSFTFTNECRINDASFMFNNCTSLKDLPRLPVSYNVVNMNKMFYNCYNAETGILELYGDALSRTPARTAEQYADCFKNCGRDTELGRAALAQISTSWGGLLNYNPLGLPAKTIRLKFKDNITPSFTYGTATQVSSSPNVWDLTYNNASWYKLLYNQTNLTEVLGANSEGVNVITYMFQGCGNLVSVALFDTTLVKSAHWLFKGCSKLTAVPKMYTRNVTSMQYMFADCSALTTCPELDTSNVDDMYGMFHSCRHLTSIPKFNMAKVVDTQYMFANCEELTTIPELNTSSLTTADFMFSNCKKLTEVSIDTSSITYLDAMFYGCSELTAIPEDFNTSNVTSMGSLFYGCKKLTSIPNLDTSRVTNFNEAFANCQSLTAIPPLDVSSATTFNSTFRSCFKVQSGAYSMYQKVAAKSSITNHTTPFSCCGIDTGTGYADLQQIPLEWGGIPTLDVATIGDREYHVVQIGNKLWMAENLDWKKSGIDIGDSSSSYTVSKANYYNDDEDTYGFTGNKSGLLYNFAAGQSIGNVDGWHVPSKAEWESMMSSIGGTGKINDLLLAGDWSYPGLVDKYGFRMRPTGYSSDWSGEKHYDSMDSSCYYLTSTAYATQQCQVVLAYVNNFQFVTPGKDSQYAIRLVKNL